MRQRSNDPPSASSILTAVVGVPLFLALNWVLSFALMMLTRIVVERDTHPEPHQPTLWVWFVLNLGWLVPLLWGLLREDTAETDDTAPAGHRTDQATGNRRGGQWRLALESATSLRLEHLPAGGVRRGRELALADLTPAEAELVEEITGGRRGTRFPLDPATVTGWSSDGHDQLAATARDLELGEGEGVGAPEVDSAGDDGDVGDGDDGDGDDGDGDDPAARPGSGPPRGPAERVLRIVYTGLCVVAALIVVGLLGTRILIDAGPLEETAADHPLFAAGLAGFGISLPVVWWGAALPLLGRWRDTREDPATRARAGQSLRLFLVLSCWAMVGILGLAAAGLWVVEALTYLLPFALVGMALFGMFGWVAGKRLR